MTIAGSPSDTMSIRFVIDAESGGAGGSSTPRSIEEEEEDLLSSQSNIHTCPHTFIIIIIIICQYMHSFVHCRCYQAGHAR